jgi:UDP-glucose 4-epimerase
MQMKRYLVTGAAGFIGGAIARKLLKQGEEVWTIDNLSTGLIENIPRGVRFIQGGCQDPETIDRLGNTRFDAILHIAGQSSGEISFDNPVYDLRTNTESTLRLIEFGLTNGCSRFIYASSMSVYGEVPDKPISESYETKPLSFYGVGKLASEHYMRIYQGCGLKPTALRYFNVYGPFQNMKNLRQGMVSIFLAQMLRDDYITVKGSKDRFRDFIYIDDIVDNTVKVINEYSTFGKVFNFGTGIKTTVCQLLDKMSKESGLQKEIVFSGITPGDQKGIVADISLAQKTFGFKCYWLLSHGLAETANWAKSAEW